MPGCWPGGTDGAADAWTGGVNRFPPVGLMLFSVGDGGGVLDGVVVVVVVVVVDGAWLPLVPHAAVVAPRAMRAVPPATASMRRPIRFELIVNLLSYRRVSLVLAVDPGRFGRGRRCDHLG
jgi:hypothetical protein